MAFVTASRENLQNIINTKIEVDGQTYNFGDFIENEIISEFPTYSYKIRNLAVKLAEVTDKYLEELDKQFSENDKSYKEIIEKNSQNISNSLNETVNTKMQEIEVVRQELLKEKEDLKQFKINLEKLKENLEKIDIDKQVSDKIQEYTNTIKNKNWIKYNNETDINWDEVIVCFDDYIWHFDYNTLKSIERLNKPIRVYEDDSSKGYAIHATFTASENSFTINKPSDISVTIDIYYTLKNN